MDGPGGDDQGVEGAFWRIDKFLHDGRIAELEEAKAEEEAEEGGKEDGTTDRTRDCRATACRTSRPGILRRWLRAMAFHAASGQDGGKRPKLKPF